MRTENFTFDAVEVAKAMMELPFGTPGGSSRHEASTKPGNCVMTIEREAGPHGFPLYFGRLVQYGDECIVVCYPGDPPEKGRWVWRGTNEQYHRTWEAD